MNPNALRTASICACIVILTFGMVPVITAADAPSGGRSNIYDESLDGSKQIADALVIAKKDNKRILLQFGANWCGWCHRLHKLFESDKAISAELKADYVIVLVDVNKDHNKDLLTKYRAGSLGLPCIAVLNADGKHLTTKNTAELEEGDHHSPTKVMAFLKDWAPKK